jgi:hypothetical protein
MAIFNSYVSLPQGIPYIIETANPAPPDPKDPTDTAQNAMLQVGRTTAPSHLQVHD